MRIFLADPSSPSLFLPLHPLPSFTLPHPSCPLSLTLPSITEWEMHITAHPPVSEMTYTVSSGTLNSTIPYHIPYLPFPFNPAWGSAECCKPTTGSGEKSRLPIVKPPLVSLVTTDLVLFLCGACPMGVWPGWPAGSATALEIRARVLLYSCALLKRSSPSPPRTCFRWHLVTSSSIRNLAGVCVFV